MTSETRSQKVIQLPLVSRDVCLRALSQRGRSPGALELPGWGGHVERHRAVPRDPSCGIPCPGSRPVSMEVLEVTQPQPWWDRKPLKDPQVRITGSSSPQIPDSYKLSEGE